MYGVVWVSLVWMYFTEVRRTEVMGSDAPDGPSFHLPHVSPEGRPAPMGTALGRA
jgi:MFS transporter, NNP family, nitrate/nitrite transporter